MNNQKTRTHYAILNISANFVGFIFNTILGFIARIIFVKYLTVDYLGLNALFSNIVMLLSLTELGIGGVISYTLYEPLAKNEREKTAALIRLFSKVYKIIGILVAVIGVSLIPFLDVVLRDSPNIDENLTYIYLLFLFSSSFSYFFSHKISLLRASQKDYIVVGLNYVITIVQSALQIVFLIWAKDYLIYLYIQVIGGIIYNFWISYIVDKQYSFLKTAKRYTLQRKEKQKIFKNVWALSVSKLSGLLVNSTDNIIISYLINVSAVGLLSNYVLITKTIGSLIGNLLISTSSGIGNFNALEDKDKTKHLFLNIQFFMFVVYGWVTAGIVVVANDIVELLFGTDYVMEQNIAIILAVNFYMVGLQSVLWIFRNALGLFNFRKYLLLVTASINLVLSFVLGMHYGVLGVLVATAIARLFTNWWYDPIVVFRYGFNNEVKKYYSIYFKYLFIVILVTSFSYTIVNNLNYSLIINILMKGTVVSTIFFISIYFIFRKKDEYKYFKIKVSYAITLLRDLYIKIQTKQ